MKKIHMLMIDCQRDFCSPAGSLFVPGADKDIPRLAAMITRLEAKISGIHVTLDSHNEIHVAHPIMWVDSNGNHPAPFTIISDDDVNAGKFRATNPACQQRLKEYVAALKANNRYPLCIWPVHCVIGTDGAAIMPELNKSLNAWCRNRFKKIDYVTKGSNIFTEHYSAIKADVIDPSDPSTMLNTGLLDILAAADEILVSGQALSHCVRNSIFDIIENFGAENIKKMILVEDTSSNVPGFENLGNEFIAMGKKRGMRTCLSTDYCV